MLPHGAIGKWIFVVGRTLATLLVCSVAATTVPQGAVLPFYTGDVVIQEMSASIDSVNDIMALVTVDYTLTNTGAATSLEIDRLPYSSVEIDGIPYPAGTVPTLDFSEGQTWQVTQRYFVAIFNDAAVATSTVSSRGIRFNPLLLLNGGPSDRRIGDYRITANLPYGASAPTQQNRPHTATFHDLAGRTIQWQDTDVYPSTLYFEYTQNVASVLLQPAFSARIAADESEHHVTVLVENKGSVPLTDVLLTGDFDPLYFAPQSPEQEFELERTPGDAPEGPTTDDERWVWRHSIKNLQPHQPQIVSYSLTIVSAVQDRLTLSPLNAIVDGRGVGASAPLQLLNDDCGNGICNSVESYLSCPEDCVYFSDAEGDGEEDFADPDDDDDGDLDAIDCEPLDPSIHHGALERCDNLDNDCDGVVDGFNRRTGSDIGECRSGRVRCEAGVWLVEAQPEVTPQPEIADGLDNDCDGVVDNDADDPDRDGVPTAEDNCPFTSNRRQHNGDRDARGDACDNCPETSNSGQADRDGDTFGDACDSCPAVHNPDQDPSWCAPPGPDSDGDTYPDEVDNCPLAANLEQADHDLDAVGTVCDNCPLHFNPDQAPLPFPQALRATDGTSLDWAGPVDVEFVRGWLADVSRRAFFDSGLLPTATGLDISTDLPPPGSGIYYLVKLPTPCGSWQTEPGAEPGRDEALP